MPADAPEPLQIGAGERLLVFAPHPDDEVLGAAALTQRVRGRGGSVRTLFFTAGDGFVEAVRARTHQDTPKPEAFIAYGTRRIREARRAAAVLGQRAGTVRMLGFPDGALLPLTAAHWDHDRPLRSATTARDRVPYPDAVVPELPYTGSDLQAALLRELRACKPTLVAFSDPLDAHDDHRAVGIFALRALAEYLRDGQAPWPRLLAYLVHHDGWPPDAENAAARPSAAPLHLPSDLPDRGQVRTCLQLDARELTKKREALAAHRSQLSFTPDFLSAFMRGTECFSVNGSEDFTF